MDNIVLLGADDVRSGGNAVREGAREMHSAASNLDHSLQMFQRFLDDWLCRFEQAVEKMPKPEPLAEQPQVTGEPAVVCPEHGRQLLDLADYEEQIGNPWKTWRCPKCGDSAHWDGTGSYE